MNLIKMAARTSRRTSRTSRRTSRREPVKVYTDGSSVGKGHNRQGGYGIVALYSDGTEERVAGPVEEGTNNQAELTAIKRTLQLYPGDYTIYSDSNYSIKALTVWYLNWQQNGWRNARGRAVLNQFLIQEILELKEQREINFKHVKAHQTATGKKDDFYYNDLADQLANHGRELVEEENESKESQPKEGRLLGSPALAASLYPFARISTTITDVYLYSKKDKFGVVVLQENKQTTEEQYSGGINLYETSLLGVEHVLTKYPGDYTIHLNNEVVVKAVSYWLTNWKNNDWYKRNGVRIKYHENWIAIDQLLDDRKITFQYYMSQ